MGGSDVDGAASAVADRVGTTHLGAGAGYRQVGIAIDRKYQGLVLAEVGVVDVIGIDGISFVLAVGNGNREAGESEGVRAGVIGSDDVAEIGAVEAKGDLIKRACSRSIEH